MTDHHIEFALNTSGQSNAKVYFWGAGFMGEWYFKTYQNKVLIQGFIDRDPEKQAQKFCGLPVFDPSHLNPATDHVYITFLGASGVSAVSEYLESLGFVLNQSYFTAVDPSGARGGLPTFYTVEENFAILIALLKAHKIRKIIVSPGTTNISFVASVQQDGYFQLYSSVDERSAAYMACGIAAQSGEPVALSCTGATAARNYIPAFTEAYYRKLPILAITTSQHMGKIGQHTPQVIDHSVALQDMAGYSTQIPSFDRKNRDDLWAAELKINIALLALRRRGGAPVFLNLATTYSGDFSRTQLPPVKVIKRLEVLDEFPDISNRSIVIFLGNHQNWGAPLTKLVESFCQRKNAVVICDQTSNYKGDYRIHPNLWMLQRGEELKVDLLLHMGEISGAYMKLQPKEVWRINPDGEVRDTFKTLTTVFEMTEASFFQGYLSNPSQVPNRIYPQLRSKCEDIPLPELPFSNLWIAQQTAGRLPENSVLHLGILHSLRCWNCFEVHASIFGFSNTGGFGIDGCVSSLVGASLCDPQRLCFGVVGDLAFFYDMNVLGNRHITPNLRLLVVNNGTGAEFSLNRQTSVVLGDSVEDYIAASGHFGRQSKELLKHYATDLGFAYHSACTKEEYLSQLEHFVDKNPREKPMIFEVFVQHKDEVASLLLLSNQEN